jgi:dihydrofolate reductase
MRKLVVTTFLSVDGVMQAPGAPDEDRSGGFELGGWSVPYWDDVMGGLVAESIEALDTLLLGRRTYEIFSQHWPHVTGDDPVAAALNGARKYVASRSLRDTEWAGSAVIEGDVVDAVAGLKDDDGADIQVQGSGNLVQTLLRHDLVDEFVLWTFPVVLGSGKRLFADGAVPAGLRLVDSTTSTTGVLINRYERAGAVAPGSFALDG